MFYLYVIAFPNNKEYVGMTDDPRRRVKQHWKDARGGSAFAVHCAIRHFGGKATFTIIEEAETRDAACELEVQLIAERGTLRPGGYNLTLGGDGGPQAKEVLARRSATRKKMGCTPAMRAWADARKGVKASAELVEKNRQAHLGLKWSEEQHARYADGGRERRSAGQKAAWTPERAAALADAARKPRPGYKGRVQSAETRAKISAAAKLRPPMSEETKRRIGAGSHATWNRRRKYPMGACAS